MNLESVGRFLIMTAVLFFIAGLLMIIMSRLGILRLPGDLVYRRGNSTFYFPLATGIVISLILTIIVNLVFWLRR